MHMYTITSRSASNETFKSTLHAGTAAEALDIFFSKTGNLGCDVIAISRIG